ncbi:MAG: hypothetical protein ACI9W2_002883 [Gammaproteobacteria bacterium]
MVPLIEVIQGDWQRQTKMRSEENAIVDLQTSQMIIELVCFHENTGGIRRRALGVGA